MMTSVGGRGAILGASQKYGGVGLLWLESQRYCKPGRGAVEGLYVTEAETPQRARDLPGGGGEVKELRAVTER